MRREREGGRERGKDRRKDRRREDLIERQQRFKVP